MSRPSKSLFVKKSQAIAVIIIMSIITISSGFLYFQREKQNILSEREDDLRAIGKLKSDQISQWYQAEIEDAGLISQNKFLQAQVAELLTTGEMKQISALRYYLTTLKREHDFEEVLLTIPDRDFLISTRKNRKSLDKNLADKIKKSIQRRKILSTDIYYCPVHRKTHLDFIAPVFAVRDESAAVIIFRLDPGAYLYPLLHSWPVRTKSARTILVRRDGDEAVLLNQASSRQDSSGGFRIPLTEENVPAVKAILGYEGIWEGKDFRGEEVLADIHSIADTPWYMITKMDKAEIYSGLYSRAIYIILVTSLVIVLITLGISYLYLLRQKNIYTSLWQTKADLEKSRKRLTTLMGHLPGMVYRHKNDSRRTMEFTSEGSMELTGYAPADLLLNHEISFGDLIYPDDKKKVSTTLEKAVKTREAFEMEYRILTRSGGTKWVWEKGRVVNYGSGDKEIIEGIILDISDRKQAEDHLKQRENQWRTLINTIPDFVWLKDKEGRYLSCNAVMERLLNAPEQEIIGRTDYDFLERDLADFFRLKDKEAISAGEARINEERVTFPDNGQQVVLETIKTPMRSESGEFIGILGIARDITFRKRMEDKIRKSEEKYRNLVESAIQPIFTVDGEGIFRFVNHASAAAFQSSQEELVGKSMWELFPKEIADRQIETIRTVIKEGKPLHHETKTRILDDTFYYHMTIAPADIEGSKAEAAICIATDISAQKKAEHDLQKSEFRYRQLFDNMQNGVVIYEATDGGKDFIIRDMNKAGETASEVSIPEIRGKRVSEVFPGIKEMGLLNVLQEVFRTGMPHHHPESFYRDNRISKWLDNYVYKLPGGEIVAVYKDITAQMKAEEALKESEEKFRTAFKTSPDSINLNRLEDGEFLEINEGFTSILGYSQEDVRGKTSLELDIWKNPADREKLAEGLKNQGYVENMEAEFLSKSGETKIGLMSARLIHLNNEPVILSITRDISQRNQAERALRENEEKFRTLFQTLTEGVVYQNSDLRITDANPAALDILGVTEAQMLGRSSYDPEWRTVRTDGSDFPGEEHPIAVALKTGKTIRDFLMGVYHPGKKEHRWISISAVPLFREGEEKPYQAYTVFSDITERIRIEAQLRERNTFIEMILDNLPIGLAVNTMDDGNVIYVNNKFEEIYGWSRQKITSVDDFFKHVYPDPQYRKKIRKQISDDIASGDTAKMSWSGIRISTSEGTEKLVAAKNIPISEQNLMISTVQDVTEQKKAEARILELNDNLQTMIESAPVAIYDLDTNGNVRSIWNPGAEQVFGWKAEEVIGKPVPYYNLLTEEQLQEFYHNFKTVLGGETIQNLHIKRPRADKSLVDISISIAPMHYASGQVYGVIALARDISQEKQAQRDLLETKNLLEKIYQSLSEAVLVVDSRDRTIVSCNSAVRKVLGFSPEEIIGQNTQMLHVDAQHYRDFAKYSEAELAEKGTFHGEFMLRRKDGHIIESEHTVTPIHETEGWENGVVSVIRDISEQKKYIKALRESQSQLRALATHLQNARENERAALAREIHDELGQMLTALKMNLVMLRKDMTAEGLPPEMARFPAEIQSMTGIIDATIHKMRRLITELRPELLDNLGLFPAIEQYVSEFSERSRMEVSLKLPEAAPELDEERSIALFRILQESLTNIARHAQASRVSVRLNRKEDYLYMQIADNGIGMNFNGEKSTKSFGILGMKERATVFGGTLDIDSRSGDGTTVSVTIPLR